MAEVYLTAEVLGLLWGADFHILPLGSLRLCDLVDAARKVGDIDVSTFNLNFGIGFTSSPPPSLQAALLPGRIATLRRQAVGDKKPPLAPDIAHLFVGVVCVIVNAVVDALFPLGKILVCRVRPYEK